MEVRIEGGAPIVKSGSDANTAAVVDVNLIRRDVNLIRAQGCVDGNANSGARGSGGAYTLDAAVTFESVAAYEPNPGVQAAVDMQLKVHRHTFRRTLRRRDLARITAARLAPQHMPRMPTQRLRLAFRSSSRLHACHPRCWRPCSRRSSARRRTFPS